MENVLHEISSKGLLVFEAGWPGVAFALLFWAGSRAVKWAMTPVPQAQEDMLHDRIMARLAIPAEWRIVGDYAIEALDRQISISPGGSGFISVGGKSVDEAIGKKRAGKVCKAAMKVRALKNEENRKSVVAASLGTIIADATTPDIKLPAVNLFPVPENFKLPDWVNPAVVDQTGKIDLNKVEHPHNLLQNPDNPFTKKEKGWKS